MLVETLLLRDNFFNGAIPSEIVGLTQLGMHLLATYDF
jgi:hypothetical protein